MKNVRIPQATKEGFIECEVGGVFDGSYPDSKTRRGRVQGGGISPTLTCNCDGLRRIEPQIVAMRGRDAQVLTAKRTEYGKQVRKQYESGELQTSRHTMQQLEPRNDGVTNTLTTVQKDNLLCEPTFRIRKLTPRECFRLMGVDDEDIDTIQAAGISNSQMYKLAGNSIVKDVLYHIFRKIYVEQQPDNGVQTLF